MRVVLAGLLLTLTLGCTLRDAPEDSGDPQTQRARDSVLGASRLPGAAGVRGALDVADSAAARRAREDAVAEDP